VSRFATAVSVNILLASDHPAIRSSLRRLLEREPDFEVVGEAADGREALLLAEQRTPDVIVLDVTLPRTGGVAAAKKILSRKQHPEIVFIAAYADEIYIAEAFKAGARGYVSADSAQLDLVRAIHSVLAGGEFVSPSISG
jgi:DNA-binding NarL/FixJ family response regulator